MLHYVETAYIYLAAGITHVLTVGSGLAADVRAQWGLPAATTVDEGPGPFKSLLVVRVRPETRCSADQVSCSGEGL